MDTLNESLDPNDLQDRVKPTVHFDEYSPNMGTDDSVIVASFSVMGQQAAFDLENFLEKGYPWILDAETSAGEIKSNHWLVFVEAERRTSFPENFIELIKDLENLTGIKLESWNMLYYLGGRKDPTYSLTKNNIAAHVPLSPKKYRDIRNSNAMLESMLNIARVPRRQGDIHGLTKAKTRPSQ